MRGCRNVLLTSVAAIAVAALVFTGWLLLEDYPAAIADRHLNGAEHVHARALTLLGQLALTHAPLLLGQLPGWMKSRTN